MSAPNPIVPGDVHQKRSANGCPIRKFWKSDFHLHTSKASSESEQASSTNHLHPMATAIHDEINARESLADDTFFCDPVLDSKLVNELPWTRNLTETINNVSRECLDRLAKLESENKELRKQYENLEAQITPLVKSLKAQEGLDHWSGHPENGRTTQAAVNCTRQQFDAQLRQLVSVLVHTNIAQNDIREDCRYLKHRVSNLESINAKLFNMVHSQRHLHCGQSCHALSQHTDPQSKRWSPDQTDDPRPMFPSIPTDNSHLPLDRLDHLRCPPSFTTSSQASDPETTYLMNDTAFESQLTLNQRCALSSPEMFTVGESPGARKTFLSSDKSVVSPSSLEANTVRNFKSTIKERLLTGCFQSVLEGVLLRASSTPQFPLADPDYPYLNEPYFATQTENSISPKAVHSVIKLTSTDQSCVDDWLPAEDCIRTTKRRTSLPLPTSHISPTTTASLDNQICGSTISPLRRRSSLSGVDEVTRSMLLPHAWLHMSILPETAVRRHPIGTRSHIILGARSLPLCMNQPVDKTHKSNNSNLLKANEPSRHSAAVLATIGSPLASRQPRAFHTQLNPIQEVETKGESYCDHVSGPQCTSSSTSSSSGSAILSNIPSGSRISSSVTKQCVSDQNGNKLKRMRRVLCKDLKRRYLCPLRLPFHTNTWGQVNQEVPGSRILDLELAFYQQSAVHKCRESQRNLRYGVFSDTELLTGKFTITSRDDSAIDTGEEDEEVQSSRESIEGSATAFIDETTQSSNSQMTSVTRTSPSDVVRESNLKQHTLIAEAVCQEETRLDDQITDRTEDLFSITNPISIVTSSEQEFVRKVSGHLEANKDSTSINASARQEPARKGVDDVVDKNTEEDGCAAQNRRQGRPNLPPPVVIHRRRFGASESTENVSLDFPQLDTDTDHNLPQPRTSKQQQQQRSPHLPDANKEISINPDMGTSNLTRPSAAVGTVGGSAATHPDLISPDAQGIATTMNTTTSSTTESTSGSDLNDISPQSPPQNATTRSTWLFKHVPAADHISQRNGNNESNRQPKQLMKSTYKSGESKAVSSAMDVYEHSSKSNRVSTEYLTSNHSPIVRVSPKALSVSRPTRTVYAPSQVPHSIVTTSRPATSPRSRREPLTCMNKPQPILKAVNSTRAMHTPQLAVLSKSSPNSPEYSFGGQKKLRTGNTSPKKRGNSKTEWIPSSQYNGSRTTRNYPRLATQVSSIMSVSPTVNRDGVDLTRLNGHSVFDTNLPAPPPIPPRTSSRTQGYQTKTTITRPSTYVTTHRSPVQAESPSSSSTSAKPSPIDMGHPRFVESPRFGSSPHSRNCSPSSINSYVYSAHLNSPGVVQQVYQPLPNCTGRSTSDSSRSPTSNPIQSLYPRLPVPITRRDGQSYVYTNRQVESGMNYYNSQNDSALPQAENTSPNLAVPSRCRMSGAHQVTASANVNMPRAEQQAYRALGKDNPQVLDASRSKDNWDRREHNHSSMTSPTPTSRWSQQASREQSSTRGYSKERPM